jgi:hypothetical protein
MSPKLKSWLMDVYPFLVGLFVGWGLANGWFQ